MRYLARMAGRATPFGLFAGCSVGAIGAEARLEIAGRSQYRRHTRLDTDYLFALADALARDPALRPAFSYRPNSSLYRSAGRVRYVESRLKDTLRSYHLVAVEPSEARSAMTPSGASATLEVLMARKSAMALVATPGTGFKRLSSIMALMPKGVAALPSPSMLEAMFMIMALIAG